MIKRTKIAQGARHEGKINAKILKVLNDLVSDGCDKFNDLFALSGC